MYRSAKKTQKNNRNDNNKNNKENLEGRGAVANGGPRLAPPAP